MSEKRNVEISFCRVAVLRQFGLCCRFMGMYRNAVMEEAAEICEREKVSVNKCPFRITHTFTYYTINTENW